MRARLRAHVNFANVVSLTALFVALGGSAYALAIPNNSVGTRQLRNDAVTSAKVKDRSLRAKDFRRGQLPKGPQGPVGPVGPAGPPGPSTGPASGVLAGTYPNPGFATDVDKLVPVAVVLVSGTGALASEAHRAPVTGAPSVLRAGTGFYRVTFPGYVPGGNDLAVCALRAYSSGGQIDGATFGSGVMDVNTYGVNGAQADKPFQCAVYDL
jgi:hypothetical protein